ncbi:hypothetical protein V6N11_018010 [Hibiscus sabdariffa]|uniref:Uncharacterized protein n=1 Tax=Hibiscus sabdariffa TaxID=183260 RepID=A0ABR2T637_9ROSI
MGVSGLVALDGVVELVLGLAGREQSLAKRLARKIGNVGLAPGDILARASRMATSQLFININKFVGIGSSGTDFVGLGMVLAVPGVGSFIYHFSFSLDSVPVNYLQVAAEIIVRLTARALFESTFGTLCRKQRLVINKGTKISVTRLNALEIKLIEQMHEIYTKCY